MSNNAVVADRKALLAKLLQEKRQTYTFALSYGQQALWVIYSNYPQNLAYNMAWAVEFQGDLEVPHLHQAVQRLIERHPALRSKISLHEGETMQTVSPSGDYTWIEDNTPANAAETANALQQIYARPFDLSNDNPLRIGLVRTADKSYTLLLVMHHIFGDAESMNILGNELLTLYRAQLTGEAVNLPTLSVTYPEFVREEKTLLDSAEGEKLLTYWQQTLGDEVPVLNLPIDHPRPSEQTYNGAAVAFRLSAELSQQLKQLAKQQGITLFPLFLSALQILLQRYTGQTDIWVGSPSSVSRHHPQFANMVGYLANSVVLRRTFDTPQQLSTQAVLSSNRQTVLEAIAHATYPFMLLVKAIKPKRDLSYSPLFQVMLDFKGSSFLALDTPNIPGVRTTRIDFPQMEGQFDLTFNIIEGECFDCTLYYNTDIFERASIERMSGHLQTLLASMAAQPQQPLAQLPLLMPAEIAQLHAWSQATLPDALLERLTAKLAIAPTDCANAKTYILDAQQQPVPVGIAGEIYLAELQNVPPTSLSAVTIELFGSPQTLYRSGEFGKWQADGTLTLLNTGSAETERAVQTEARQSSYVYPRDDVEFRLAQLWEDLLDVSPSVLDDFFDIGGDSLLGIRLLFNIEKAFGVSIQIHSLMQNKTLEQLACLLREKHHSDEPWSPLVCLQEDGDKTPFFFVHASGGSAFDYFEIAKLMGDERPFYAVQPLGIEMGQAFHPSIEAMAADYVIAIQEIQESGPYLLGGWSFGGTVAFEMARILEAAGETVGLVLMVDTPEPTADVCKQDDFEFLMDRLPHYYGVTLDNLDMQDSTEEKIAYLLQEVKLSGLFTPDIDQTYAHHWFDMYKHHNRIVATYQPSDAIAANIAFLKPSEKIPFDLQMGNPAQVWRQFAKGQYEVFDAPGNHFNMISPINTPALVDKMMEYIERWYEQCPRVQQARTSGHD